MGPPQPRASEAEGPEPTRARPSGHVPAAQCELGCVRPSACYGPWLPGRVTAGPTRKLGEVQAPGALTRQRVRATPRASVGQRACVCGSGAVRRLSTLPGSEWLCVACPALALAVTGSGRELSWRWQARASAVSSVLKLPVPSATGILLGLPLPVRGLWGEGWEALRPAVRQAPNQCFCAHPVNPRSGTRTS